MIWLKTVSRLTAWCHQGWVSSVRVSVSQLWLM
jgi:hypothetical protein